MTDLSLLQDFVSETVEHLEEMEGNLLQLESDPGNRETLNNIFRSLHTIKGAAEYLGMERIAELSHKLENLLDLMRRNAQSANRAVIDLLLAARDRIGSLTADLHQTQQEQTNIDDLLARIAALDHNTPRTSGERPADAADNAAPGANVGTGETPPYAPYIEEHDEELFGIFLEQLQEGLDALQTWTETLTGIDPVDGIEILGRCREQIDPLRSSANYMGYGKLTSLYDRWDSAIRKARERLASDDQDFLTAFIANDMQANIDAIRAAFPQLTRPTGSPTVSAAQASSIDENPLALEYDDLMATVDPDDHPIGIQAQDGPPTVLTEEDGDLPGDLKLFLDGPCEDDDIPLLDESESRLDLGLLQDFINETTEHLGEMEDRLIEFESDPDNRDTLNDIFRAVHTIKGAAEYLGMVRIAELSHKLENLLDQMRHNERHASRSIIDLLMAARDRIGILIADLHQTQTEQAEVDDLVTRIAALETDAPAPSKQNSEMAPSGPSPVPRETYPAAPQDSVRGEIYDEEQDEELFGIFLEQLQEGLEALQGWTTALAEAEHADRLAYLERCLGQIDPLRSSANYMGYRQLTALYDRWSDAVRTARERLENEDDQFLPAFIAGCMQATIDDISRCFPRLERLRSTTPPPSADQTASGPLTDIADTASAQTPDDDLPAGGPLADGARLFERLSRSFDRRLVECQAPENETAPSSMELELFSEDHPTGFTEPKPSLPDLPSSDDWDPLTAYADAPASTAWEMPSEIDIPGDGSFPATETPVAETTPSDLDSAPDETLDEAPPAEDPASDREASKVSETLPEWSPETSPQPPAAEVPIREMDLASEALGGEASAIASPSNEITSDGLVLPAEERRDPVNQGRRRSDRIGEQLLKQSIRVDAAKIDELMNQVGELVVSRAWFSQLFHEMRDLQQNLQHNASLESREMKQVKGLTFRLSEATVALGRVANELQEGVMKVRMLPIAQLFSRYPRLVFDLVRESDKKVKLDIKGEDTELDKMVIEAISDPLIHIIRNAVDHGIESPAERRGQGKFESGTIHLEAYHEGNHVVIEIADDGQGLDIDRIKKKALTDHFAAPEEIERMSVKELTGLIMQPGFSTAAQVTHTSGRGVGMDVVKQNIEKLNGTIEIDTIPGVETRFRIKIPLTLAIIPALLVQVRGELFTIPLSTVEETIRIAKGDLSTIEGVEVLQLRESTLPLVRLAELFNMPAKPFNDDRAFVVVVSTGMKRVGLVVDALLGQEEVVIKPLEDYLQEKSGFSGATILGDGRISLILDIYELVNLSIDRQAQRKRVAAPV